MDIKAIPARARVRPKTAGYCFGPGEGGLVALIWKNLDDTDHPDDWEANTVGDVEMVNSKILAERDDYKHLATMDVDIPTVVLNSSYSPLKQYIHARSRDLTDEGAARSADRYAIGIGVGLIMLDNMERSAEKNGQGMDPDALRGSQRSAARSVLSVLPEYDDLAREVAEG